MIKKRRRSVKLLNMPKHLPNDSIAVANPKKLKEIQKLEKVDEVEDEMDEASNYSFSDSDFSEEFKKKP